MVRQSLQNPAGNGKQSLNESAMALLLGQYLQGQNQGLGQGSMDQLKEFGEKVIVDKLNKVLEEMKQTD